MFFAFDVLIPLLATFGFQSLFSVLSKRHFFPENFHAASDPVGLWWVSFFGIVPKLDVQGCGKRGASYARKCQFGCSLGTDDVAVAARLSVQYLSGVCGWQHLWLRG